MNIPLHLWISVNPVEKEMVLSIELWPPHVDAGAYS